MYSLKNLIAKLPHEQSSTPFNERIYQNYTYNRNCIGISNTCVITLTLLPSPSSSLSLLSVGSIGILATGFFPPVAAANLFEEL